MRIITRNATPSRRRAIRPRSALSLVDLTITVLVIGILAGVAMPRFATSVSRIKAEAVARRIAADLNYARRYAILTSRSVTITFTLVPAGYGMTGVPHPDRPAEAYNVLLADVDPNVTLTAASFNGGLVLSYNAYGRPLVGAASLTTGTVSVSSGGQTFGVVIDPSTAEARAQ